jgi:hypothetical protein
MHPHISSELLATGWRHKAQDSDPGLQLKAQDSDPNEHIFENRVTTAWAEQDARNLSPSPNKEQVRTSDDKAANTHILHANTNTLHANTDFARGRPFTAHTMKPNDQRGRDFDAENTHTMHVNTEFDHDMPGTARMFQANQRRRDSDAAKRTTAVRQEDFVVITALNLFDQLPRIGEHTLRTVGNRFYGDVVEMRGLLRDVLGDRDAFWRACCVLRDSESVRKAGADRDHVTVHRKVCVCMYLCVCMYVCMYVR